MQPRRAPHHVIQAPTSEGFAQGPCLAAGMEFEQATFHTEGTEHHQSTITPLMIDEAIAWI